MAKNGNSLSMAILSFVGLVLVFAIVGILLLVAQKIKEFSNYEFVTTKIENNQQENFEVGSLLETQVYEASELKRGELYDVVSVVDGDTIVVLINNEKRKVRLLGVNTPETVDPKVKPQCFGKEASDALKRLLENNKVQLVRDDSQGNEDKYGRLLRYVYLDNGLNVNEYMISNGFAYEYTYSKKYLMRDVFLKDQAVAKMSGKGLWSLQTCAGKL